MVFRRQLRRHSSVIMCSHKVRALRLSFIFGIGLVVPVVLHAIGVPHIHIDELVANSDVIVIAEVAEVKLVGPATPVEFRGQTLEAAEYSSEILIYRYIKGSAGARLSVKYVLPRSFVGYSGLHTGTRMVFLRRAKGAYEPTDLYYADSPALRIGQSTSDSQGKSGDFTSSVIRELLSVISSPDASASEKSEILRIDYAFSPSREVVQAFRTGVTNTSDPNLRQRLQGELIALGDITELPQIVMLLTSKTVTPDQEVWLLYVVGNRITNSRAIDELRPLLRSRDDRLREAAAQALWNIKDIAALPDLNTALYDSDSKVRFYAVRALSDIAQEPGWGGPNEALFQERESEYLQHWRNWVSARAN